MSNLFVIAYLFFWTYNNYDNEYGIYSVYSVLTSVLCTQSDMEQRVSDISVPGEEFYSGFVTRRALEDALKDLRDSLSAELMSSERTVIEASNQTDPVSRDINLFINYN